MDQQHIENWLNKRKLRRTSRSVASLFDKLLKGDLVALSSCITLLESTLPADKEMANDLIQSKSYRMLGNQFVLELQVFLALGKAPSLKLSVKSSFKKG